VSSAVSYNTDVKNYFIKNRFLLYMPFLFIYLSLAQLAPLACECKLPPPPPRVGDDDSECAPLSSFAFGRCIDEESDDEEDKDDDELEQSGRWGW